MRINEILANIDLTKSNNSNFPYLNREKLNQKFNYEDELPLEVESSEWKIESDHMSRVYKIDNREHFSYFLSNIFSYAAKVNHDPVLMIKFPKITVKLKTDTVDEVTELDIEFSKFADEIFEDIRFLKEEF